MKGRLILIRRRWSSGWDGGVDHQGHPERGVLTSASQVSSVTGPAVTLAGAARTITRRGVRTADGLDAGARAAQREWATDSAIFQDSRFQAMITMYLLSTGNSQ